MSLWESIGLQAKAFFANPFLYVTNSDAAVVEYEVKVKIAAGESSSDIKKALENKGFGEGVSPVVKVAKFIVNNLPLLLTLFLIGVAFFYISPFLRRNNA